jgi:hypothetical protein
MAEEWNSCRPREPQEVNHADDHPDDPMIPNDLLQNLENKASAVERERLEREAQETFKDVSSATSEIPYLCFTSHGSHCKRARSPEEHFVEKSLAVRR